MVVYDDAGGNMAAISDPNSTAGVQLKRHPNYVTGMT